jgi:hypothetical protein
MPKFLSNIEINAIPSASNHAARIVDLEKFYKVVDYVAGKGVVGDLAGNILTVPVAAILEGQTQQYGDSDINQTWDSAAGEWETSQPEVGDVILLTKQADPIENGIYKVNQELTPMSTLGLILERVPGFDVGATLVPGLKIFVKDGADGGNTYRLTETFGGVVGTDDIEFELEGGITELPDIDGLVLEKVLTITGDGSTSEFSAVLPTDFAPTGTGFFDYTVDIYEVNNNGNQHNPVYVDYAKDYATSTNAVLLDFALAPANGQEYKIIVRRIKPAAV